MGLMAQEAPAAQTKTNVPITMIATNQSRLIGEWDYVCYTDKAVVLQALFWYPPNSVQLKKVSLAQ